MAETAKTTDGSKAKKRTGSVLFWVLGASALFAFYESFALLAIGMVPTVVAVIIDRTSNKNAARTVAYTNFAGYLPWLMDYWLAGGGIKGGVGYGATDELGYKAVEHPTYSYDLHATALHLLGVDHTRLTFYHNGIERRLTNVHGELVHGILA